MTWAMVADSIAYIGTPLGPGVERHGLSQALDHAARLVLDGDLGAYHGLLDSLDTAAASSTDVARRGAIYRAMGDAIEARCSPS